MFEHCKYVASLPRSVSPMCVLLFVVGVAGASPPGDPMGSLPTMQEHTEQTCVRPGRGFKHVIVFTGSAGVAAAIVFARTHGNRQDTGNYLQGDSRQTCACYIDAETKLVTKPSKQQRGAHGPSRVAAMRLRCLCCLPHLQPPTVMRQRDKQTPLLAGRPLRQTKDQLER